MKIRLPLLLLCFLLIAGSLAGCALSGRETAIGSVTLTDEVDAVSKAAKTALSSFPKEAKTFYASVQVLHPDKGTRVGARWFYDKDGNGSYNLIDSAEVTFAQSGDRYAAFSLTATSTFPSGAYKVIVLLNGNEVRELKFSVL
ncbi:MAG: hypothetical protein ACM3XM_05690 [Mycobacterium leprae]